MKLNFSILVLFFLLVLPLSGLAQQKNDKEEVMKRVEEEADRLQRVLELEDWQLFYVDSTLKHDYNEMIMELEALQAAKVANASMYMNIQDKWMEQIDQTYKRIFNEEQWAAYLKSGAAKAQKARDKRKAKAGK